MPEWVYVKLKNTDTYLLLCKTTKIFPVCYSGGYTYHHLWCMIIVN
jgi:hypothetical protein